MTELSCRNCGHAWTYTGSLTDYTSCPTCSSSVKIPDSSDNGSKTKGRKDDNTELEDRVKVLEKTVEMLYHRLPDGNEQRGSKTDSGDRGGDKEKNNLFYDPTEEF